MGIKIAVAIATALYVLCILTGVISADHKLGPAEYGLIVFTVLFLANFFDKLAEISFGKEGFKFQLNEVRGRQNETEAMLGAIQVVLKGLVTKYEYKHLQDLNASGPCMRRYGDIFFDEIRRLDAVAFIRPAPSSSGFNAIREQHEHDGNEFDLKQYMEITDEGRAYVHIRTATEAGKLA
jgi:hypothetical protein